MTTITHTPASQIKNRERTREHHTSREPVVSIVIISYNYKRYLPFAVASALGQTYSRVEIVLVDDGSTDGSREVIASFGDRLKPCLKANGGETSANNTGFAMSTGEIIMFLDADDALHPKAAEEIVAHWRPEVAKAQFRLATIDEEGGFIGAVVPSCAAIATPEDIRLSVRATGFYGWPPTSGNGYARWFLEEIMPLPIGEFPDAPDGVLNAVAPLYGDVIAIDQVLGYYRIHGANALASRQLGAKDIQRELAMRTRETRYFLSCAARLGFALKANPFDSMWFLERRMALLRLAPSLAGKGESKWDLLSRAFRSPAPTDRSLFTRCILFISFLIVALAPRRLANRVAELRLAPGSRPKFFNFALRQFGSGVHTWLSASPQPVFQASGARTSDSGAR
ncbi:MAG: glycosyltransferase family 2 protein [Verrucomicrobia bacterium]|nr:glycosyltransferase family 2 protein [Verrucomicrobiota bacterium]